MTVPKNNIVHNYKGNGITTQFDFDFLIEKKSELLVLHTNSSGKQKELTLDLDYSINKIGNPNGSYIVFPLEDSEYKVLSKDETITLLLNLEIEQEKEYSNSAKLDLESLEKSFDYNIRLMQILNRKIERCVKVQEGSSSTVDEFLNELIQARDDSQESANRAYHYAEQANNYKADSAEIFNSVQTLSTNEKNAIEQLTQNSLNEIEYKSTFQTRSIGETVKSDIPLSDAGLHLKDGALINGSGLYAAFVEKMANLSIENPVLFTNETTWQNAVSTYGFCNKYVYNRTNNTIRLPKIKSNERYLISSNSSNRGFKRIYSDGWCEQGGYHTNTLTANGIFTLSLPIPFLTDAYDFKRTAHWKGTTDLNTIYSSGYSSKTASDVTMYGYSTAQIDGYWWSAKGYIDISEYNNNIKGKIYEYVVIATSTKSNAEIEVNNIISDLNGKADTDLTNCNISNTFIQNLARAGIVFIVESYSGEDGWYNIWSNGKCEQGGQLVRTAAGVSHVTFLKEMKDAKYHPKITYVGADSYNTSANFYSCYVTQKTTTGMNVVSPSAIASMEYIDWEVKGFIK